MIEIASGGLSTRSQLVEQRKSTTERVAGVIVRAIREPGWRKKSTLYLAKELYDELGCDKIEFEGFTLPVICNDRLQETTIHLRVGE